MTLLLEIADTYLSSRDVSRAYGRVVKRLSRECPAATAGDINAYLTRRLTQVAPVTVAHERVVLLTLWRWGYEQSMLPNAPRGVMRIRTSLRPTRAWTISDCQRLARGCHTFPGPPMKYGVSRGDFLLCWILLGYETGARMGDLWEFRRDDLDGDGNIRWTQGKSRTPQYARLTAACMAAVTKMLEHSPDGRILGWVACKSHGCILMKRYLRTMGLAGTSKWLRRSSATHIEMEFPGKGKMHLGHSPRSNGLAERCYIDWSQVRKDQPPAPALMN